MPPLETDRTTQPEDQGTGNAIANGTGVRRSISIWTIVCIFLIFVWLLGWHFHIGDGWIHLLLIVALLALLRAVVLSFSLAKNIEAEESAIPKWIADRPADSLSEIHAYVIREAGKSIKWYWRAKRTKSILSQVIRFSAWVLAAAGGLLPVVGSLFKNHLPVNLSDGLWASLLLGIAAALVGLDKAFGYSSGWARYVLTATNLHKTLEEFRMEWAELMVKAGTSLTPENVTPLIDRAIKFRTDVEGLVLQETKDWVTEFQTNMVQMEKDIVAQVAALKAEADKATQAKKVAEQPGAIQLQIQNSNKADTGTPISVLLTDAKDNTIQDTVSGATWARLNLLAGQYKIKIQATVQGHGAEDQKVVVVKPGAVAEVQLSL
jgi:hypothetical protein